VSREEINQMKAERDALNEKVKLFKEQRDLLRGRITPIMEKIKLIEEKIDELKKTVPRVSQRELQEEVDAIEWKIQTTTLDVTEEKRLIEEVKKLEIQLISYKRIDKKHKKIKDLLDQRKTMDAQADVFHMEVTDLAKKSQELHSRMIEKINGVKKDKVEADNLHQTFVKTKEQTALLYEQVSQLINQTRGLKATIKEYDQTKRRDEEVNRKKEQAERAGKEQVIKEKLGSEAKEKLQRGEKISWDEFQLLLTDDEEADSKTQD
jgi:uncharacterized coiled-coil DUF342 family protein